MAHGHLKKTIAGHGFPALLRYLLATLIILVAVPTSAETAYPVLTAYVTDGANLIESGTRDSLEAELKQLEAETTAQVVVVTVSTLGGEAVEDYAQSLFVANKIGQKGKDNGVLLLVARQERKLRIHTGYGMESVIPDIIAGRIIRDVITKKTKAEDWSGGIADGTRAMIWRVRNPDANPDAVLGPASKAAKGTHAHSAKADGKILGMEPIVFILLMIALVVLIYLAIRFGGGGSGGGSDYTYYGGGGGGGWGSSDGGGGGGFSGGGGDSGGGGASGDG